MKKPAETARIRLMAALNALLIVLGLFSAFFANTPVTNAENGQTAAVSSGSATRISDNTLIIYEYFNTTDSTTDTITKPAGKSLAGLTRPELERHFQDWDVISVTPDEVVLRKDK